MNHPVASVLRGPDVASAALRRFASHWLDPEWGLMHPQQEMREAVQTQSPFCFFAP